MSAVPGWYPDPGGQPGMMRYWDGRTWSAEVRPTGSAGGPPASAPFPSGYDRTGRPAGQAQPTARRRSPIGWVLAGLGVAAVLGLVVFLVLRFVIGSSVIADPPPRSDDPRPSQPISCPDAVEATAAPVPQNDGRVHSGKLSYPELGPPFEAPQWDRRAPFGRDVLTQNAPVETSASGDETWVAGVLIARLLAGDGFFGPEQGAQLVATCIVGKFYGNNEVDRTDKRNEAMKVDGHDAWLIEMHLTFDIPDIKTKGEQAIVVVVDTADGEGGLFYSSVPDTSPQFVEPAAQSLAALTVDG